jgi:hypothetical protein
LSLAGPVLVLDKSAFQSFSYKEHHFVWKHFWHNLTPVLVAEVLADLSKVGTRQSPAEEVQVLSKKFHGSGTAPNTDYRSLMIHSLLGQSVSMDGRVVLPKIETVPCGDGSYGLVVPLTPTNESIMRWARGQFTKEEEAMAWQWRLASQSLSLDSLNRDLMLNHVIIPRASSLAEALSNVDELLDRTALQDIWLDFLLKQAWLPPKQEVLIKARWRGPPRSFIRDFAPYASFCLRATLLLASAQKFKLVGTQPTHAIDLHYLFYLPFCMVFVSDDGLHRALVPVLKRTDQEFVSGQDLKADLKGLSDFWSGLEPTRQLRYKFALGFWPPPRASSVVSALWRRYMSPWRPGLGNMVSSLPIEEKKLAMQEVAALYREVEGEDYFAGVDLQANDIKTLSEAEQAELVRYLDGLWRSGDTLLK